MSQSDAIGSPPRLVRCRSGCASMALFTGAFASGCVGIQGIVGMALGIGAGIVPVMVFRRSGYG